LQDLTKEYSCHLVISDEVARQSQMNAAGLARYEITVRNRHEALNIFVVDDLSTMGAGETVKQLE
jgi:hypothetical protein